MKPIYEIDTFKVSEKRPFLGTITTTEGLRVDIYGPCPELTNSYQAVTRDNYNIQIRDPASITSRIHHTPQEVFDFCLAHWNLSQ